MEEGCRPGRGQTPARKQPLAPTTSTQRRAVRPERARRSAVHDTAAHENADATRERDGRGLEAV
eukprot:3487284-Rhodomonas_salina.1